MAIIQQDISKFKEVQKSIRDLVKKSGSELPDHSDISIKRITGMRGSILRQLMSRALQTAIFVNDLTAIS